MNLRGGKWVVQLKKGLSTYCWETLVCACARVRTFSVCLLAASAASVVVVSVAAVVAAAAAAVVADTVVVAVIIVAVAFVAVNLRLFSCFLYAQLLGLIGGHFAAAGDDVCGVALSVRTHEDHMSIWHKTADNEAVKTLLE